MTAHFWQASVVISNFTNFFRCQYLIARKIDELFGFNHGNWPFYAACFFSELNSGSVSHHLNASFGKQFHDTTTRLFTQKLMSLASTRAIQAEYLPNGGIRWLSRVALDLPYWAIAQHHSGASLWPPKWSAKEVHLFVAGPSFVWINIVIVIQN